MRISLALLVDWDTTPDSNTLLGFGLAIYESMRTMLTLIPEQNDFRHWSDRWEHQRALQRHYMACHLLDLRPCRHCHRDADILALLCRSHGNIYSDLPPLPTNVTESPETGDGLAHATHVKFWRALERPGDCSCF
jgi:hypothetical protein